MLFLWLFKDKLHVYHSLNMVLYARFEENNDKKQLHLYNLWCCITKLYTFARHINLTVQCVLMLPLRVNQVYRLDCEFLQQASQQADFYRKRASTCTHLRAGWKHRWGKEGACGHICLYTPNRKWFSQSNTSNSNDYLPQK